MEERNDIVIYKTEDGLVTMEAMVDPAGETIWATQKAIAALFGKDVSDISRHIRNVYSRGELSEESTLQKMQIAFSDKPVQYYNLDMMKDASFHSSIGQIYQTWDGKDLYPSIEEKAAMLLYLVVKNHSFVDGNKRIAATLFLWFMQNNGILYRPGGTKRISDASLVALTLMIAESHTDEMDTMVKVVVSLINRKN